jgi:hypothetical protein
MNLNNINKIENFDTNIDYTKTINFESNTSVNTQSIIKSINNIINKSKNDVLQNNTAALSALASAVNSFSLMNNTAKVISVTDVNMENQADAQITGDQNQTVINEVSESFEKSFNNQLNNEANDNNNINKNNSKNLENIMNQLPLPPGIPKPGIMDQINAIVGLGTNKTKNNINADVNSSIKKMLSIDDSLNINLTNDVNNEINNTVKQTNFTSCAVAAMAKNNINIYESTAKNIIVDNVKQTAIANANLECSVNQENISKISNKIVTNISTYINNLYSAINSEPVLNPNKYEYLFHLSKAISDKIITAGNKDQTPPTNQPPAETIPEPIQKQPEIQPEPIQEPEIQPEPEPVIQPKKISFIESNKYLIGGFVIFVIILIILIIFILLKKNKS